GCFLNGCCFGSTCDLPWAVRFPFGSPPSIEQWKEKLPGAALPAELIAVYGEVFTQPLTRESLQAEPAEFQAAADASAKVAQLKEKLKGATDAAAKDQITREIRAAEADGVGFGCDRRGGGACNPPYVARYADPRDVINREGTTLDAVRALAAQHPSLPV